MAIKKATMDEIVAESTMARVTAIVSKYLKM